MGLRGNKGLKYFPLVTDFFQDRDVRRLMLSQGEIGVLLYIYILCATYAKSYYLKWDEDMLMDASIDLRCEASRLPPILDYMLEKGFFDRRLFEEKGILSSKAVQRQFQECARVMKRKVLIDRELWLLEESDTLHCIYYSDAVEIPEDSGKTGENSGKTSENSGISTQRKGKKKEKKLNEREGEGIATAPEGPRNDSTCGAGPLLSQPEADSSPPEGGKPWGDGLLRYARNDRTGEATPHPAALPPPSPQGGKAFIDHYKEKLDLGGRGEQELRDYCDTLGQELCLFALERALEQDKPHWSYVRAILRSYKQQGFTELSQAKDEQQRHRQSFRRENYGFSGRNVQPSCQGYEPVDMEKLKKMYDLI